MNVPEWRHHRISGLAVSVGALCLVLAVPALVLLIRNAASAGLSTSEFLVRAGSIGVHVTLGGVGVLVASRRPANAIGWLIGASGGLGVLDHFATQYAIYSLGTAPGSLVAGDWAAWLQSSLWIAQFSVTAFLFFLFPDGHLASRRWRPVAWATLVGSGLLLVGFGFAPGELMNAPYSLSPLANPFGLDVPASIMSAIGLLGFGVLTAGIVAAVASQVLRFRIARGEQHQQLKWFAYAAALMGLWIVENFILNTLLSWFSGNPRPTLSQRAAY